MRDAARFYMYFDYETRRGRVIPIRVTFRDGGAFYEEGATLPSHDLGWESVDITDRDGNTLVECSSAALRALELNDEFGAYVWSAGSCNG